jgi:hypothetical protein
MFDRKQRGFGHRKRNRSAEPEHQHLSNQERREISADHEMRLAQMLEKTDSFRRRQPDAGESPLAREMYSAVVRAFGLTIETQDLDRLRNFPQSGLSAHQQTQGMMVR